MDNSMKRRLPRLKNAFTLIELLVVITIIGILVGLAMPAYSTAIQSAKKAQASVMIQQLRTALNNYQLDYGTWPSVLLNASNYTVTSNSSTELYQDLIGSTQTTAAGQNPRMTVYMQFKTTDLLPTGTTGPAATGFIDPWGGSYYIMVDGNYTNQLTVPNLNSGSNGTTTTINAQIAIYSKGKPGSAQNKWVGSW